MKYKKWALVLALMTASLFPAQKTDAMTGSGTLADPYIIMNVNDLQSMNSCLSCHYKIGQIIDASATSGWNTGKGFKPIGTQANPFTGSLDGGFKPIYNLEIKRGTEDYVGLFGYIDSVHTIKNVGIYGNIEGRNYTGGFAGYAKGNIEHIYAQGFLYGENYTGGIAGVFQGNAQIVSYGSFLDGGNYIGGIFGEFKSGYLSDASSMFTALDGGNTIGGIIGMLRAGTTVKNAVSISGRSDPTGQVLPVTIYGTSGVGALVGVNEGGTVINSYWNRDKVLPNISAGGTGLTNTVSKQQSSYTGWDFTDVWAGLNSIDPSLDFIPLPRGFLYLNGMTGTPPPPPPPLVPASPPSSPSGLTATQRTTTSVTLTWDASPTATNYVIKRDGVQVSSGSGTSFTDSGLTKTTAYLYEVIAQNADGDSPPAALNVTTLTDDWVMVSAGGEHVLGLKNNGTVWAWGKNQYGQLGTGNTTTATVPVQVRGVGGSGFLTNAKEVSAGYFSSYALLADGTVAAWGQNYAYEMGDNTTTERRTPVRVRNAANTGNLTNIVKIHGGAYFAHALDSSGKVYAWGINGDGQLGLGTTSTGRLPALVKDETNTGNLSNVSDIGATNKASFAVKNDGTVVSWGRAEYGVLGDGSYSGNVLYPQAVPGLINVQSIHTGERHVASQKQDNSVQIWGNNLWGQYGNGTSTNSNVPVQVNAFNPVKSMSLGDDRTFALRTDGTLWGSGFAQNGELGNNMVYPPPAYKSDVPVRVVNSDGTNTLNDVIYVHASKYGSDATYYIRADGTLWGFGDNQYSQLGDGTTTFRMIPVKVGEVAPPTFASSTFTANNITTSSIRLNWVSNAVATNYIVKRNGVQIYSGTSLSFTDSGLNPDTTYTYELIAQNAGGDSPPSSLNAKTLVLRVWNIIAPNPSVNFGTATIDDTVQSLNVNLGTLKVSHQGANPDGWRVTVSATPFSQVNGGSLALPVNSLKLNGIQNIVQTAGSSLLPTATAGGSTMIDNGAFEVLNAPVGAGEGDFDVSFPPDALELNIDTSLPLVSISSNPTIYRSIITWSMSVGP